MPASRKPKSPSISHRAQDAIFSQVHGGNLVYNTCWEDPRLDREMLNLQPDSRVVMITSAGCNALDYLLDGPAQIHAVDMNPRQNALLQLKIAMIQLHRALRERDMETKIILQIHDELILEGPEDGAVEALARVRMLCEGVLSGVLMAPLQTSGGTGRNWEEAK